MKVHSWPKVGTASCLIALAMSSSASPLSKDSLIEDCRAYSSAPESIPAARCALYIQGFLDGTRAAEARRARSERTLRTPFGSRVARDPVAKRAEYCLERDISIPEIISSVVSHDKNKATAEAPAHELLHEVFRQHYPCNTK